jgi:hypothetical protein
MIKMVKSLLNCNNSINFYDYLLYPIGRVSTHVDPVSTLRRCKMPGPEEENQSVGQSGTLQDQTQYPSTPEEQRQLGEDYSGLR